MAERVNIPNSVQVTQCLRPDSFPPDNSDGNLSDKCSNCIVDKIEPILLSCIKL